MTMTVTMQSSKFLLCLTICLWCCHCSALRGTRTNPRKLVDDESLTIAATSEEACMPLQMVSPKVRYHELSDESCRLHNECAGGCCRHYYWLICDDTASYDDMPCVCSNSNTEIISSYKEKEEEAESHENNGDNDDTTIISAAFQSPENTTDDQYYYTATSGGPLDNNTYTNASASTAAANATAMPAEMPPQMPISTAASTTEEPTSVPTATPFPTRAPIIPTQAPTISPDACATGSPYEGMLAFRQYSTCETSYDCISVQRERRVLKNDKETATGNNVEEDLIDFTTDDTTFCCLAELCMCGSPNGNWEGKCVPPYILPDTEAPTFAPTTVVEPTVAAHTSTLSPTKAPVKVETLATPAPSTPQPTDIPTMAYKTPLPTFSPTSILTPKPTNAPTISSNGMPAPTNLPTKNASPTTPQPTNLPTTISYIIEGASEANSNHGGDSNTISTTKCSKGSWYHSDPNFAEYRPCERSQECLDNSAARDETSIPATKEPECCLVEFCFCGTPNGNPRNCVEQAD